MPLEERRARHEALYASICEYDVERWQREFIAALRGQTGTAVECLASRPHPGTKGEPAKLIDNLQQVRELMVETENNP
jgi:trehalose-6-phosphate synthase